MIFSLPSPLWCRGLLLWGLALTPYPPAYGSACCNGSSGGNGQVIVADDKFLYTAVLSRDYSVAEANQAGAIFFRRSPSLSQNFGQSFTYRISPRWQAGGQIALIRKKSYAQVTGLGDPKVYTNFEVWPEYAYSLWRPRGFLQLSYSYPLAPSIYQSTQSNLEARGSGQHQISLALLLSKRLRDKSLRFSIGSILSLPAKLQKDRHTFFIKSKPGWRIGLAFLSPLTSKVSFRLALDHTQFATKTVNQRKRPKAHLTQVSTSLAYTLSPTQSLSLNWRDQTLLGRPVNTTLTRGPSLNYSITSPL